VKRPRLVQENRQSREGHRRTKKKGTLSKQQAALTREIAAEAASHDLGWRSAVRGQVLRLRGEMGKPREEALRRPCFS